MPIRENDIKINRSITFEPFMPYDLSGPPDYLTFRTNKTCILIAIGTNQRFY